LSATQASTLGFHEQLADRTVLSAPSGSAGYDRKTAQAVSADATKSHRWIRGVPDEGLVPATCLRDLPSTPMDGTDSQADSRQHRPSRGTAW
jgi:hypothetical protein